MPRRARNRVRRFSFLGVKSQTLRNLAVYARKPAGLVPGLSPPGRGEAEPLLKEEREGQGYLLHQVIYNQ